MMRLSLAFALLVLLGCVGCTFSHSKQALWAGTAPAPLATATFVTTEDSGLMLFGLFTLAEPDHYAVLLERARRQFKCDRMRDAQLDFYTEHWIIVAYPISRITLLCERDPAPRGQP